GLGFRRTRLLGWTVSGPARSGRFGCRVGGSVRYPGLGFPGQIPSPAGCEGVAGISTDECSRVVRSAQHFRRTMSALAGLLFYGRSPPRFILALGSIDWSIGAGGRDPCLALRLGRLLVDPFADPIGSTHR